LQLERNEDLVDVVSGLAQRILAALALPPLPPLGARPAVNTLANAFELQAPTLSGTRASPATPNVAYFVFAAATRQEIGTTQRADHDAWGSSDGWDWRPYHPQSPESAGALAQHVAGDKNLRFVQVACDPQLPTRLMEAKRQNTPVVIFADPWTVN